jgi:hypothetical protein
MTNVVQESHPPIDKQPVFFPVSLPKLAILATFTLGLYDLYWFYQNWKLEQVRNGKPFGLSPGIRAFFSPISAYSLFKRVNLQLDKAGAQKIQAGLLALGYFIWISTWRLPDPMWLISTFSFVPLLPIQAAINRLNDTVAPNAPRNDRYSGANVAAIIIGALLLGLIILGLLLPPESTDGLPPLVST